MGHAIQHEMFGSLIVLVFLQFVALIFVFLSIHSCMCVSLSKMLLQCWFLLQINVFFGEENIFLTPEAYALFG